jgi:hypothetical protein
MIKRIIDVRLAIYDDSGRFVKEILNGRLNPDSYIIPWNGESSAGRITSSGVYFVVLRTPDYIVSKKIIHLK